MNQLNWFEAWMLNGILKKIINNRGLSSLFFEILMLARDKFYEDNDPTLLGYVDDEYNRGKAFYEATQAIELAKILRTSHG